jgi:hypothetical protein
MAASRTVLVIGVGSIGERHVRCFQSTGRAEISLCEIDLDLGKQIAQRYEVDQVYAELDAALDGRPDAAVIATAETRFLAFTTMAYGARGISYFLYWGPKSYGGLYSDGEPSFMVKEVAAINAEIAHFGPALMELDSTAVYHTAPLPYGTQAVPADAPLRFTGGGEFVLGLFGKNGKTTAFMVVNRSYNQNAEAAVKIEIPSSKLQELDRTIGKWSDGPVMDANRDRTASHAGHVLRLAVKRSGVEVWPRLWHSMRSTRQTELVERFPVHVTCSWLGNTIDVAATHYLKTTQQHFIEATKVAQKAAQHAPAHGGTDPKVVIS